MWVKFNSKDTKESEKWFELRGTKFEENLVSFWWEVDILYVLDRCQWEYLWEGSGKVGEGILSLLNT